jgi:hypothetical protein
VSEDRLAIRPNGIFVNLEFTHKLRIHNLNRFDGSIRLEFPNIGGTEEELSVKIGFLDCVEIGDSKVYTIATCNDPHHCPILEHFTTNRTCANEELFHFGESFMEIFSKYHNLSIIPRANLY